MAIDDTPFLDKFEQAFSFLRDCAATEKGFMLDEPKIQVFEKKAKVVENN